MKEKYLEMQRRYYRRKASEWSLENRNPVVGSYDLHNNYKGYDDYLFPEGDFSNKLALEYGCGPARNLVRFNSKFSRIDGVDIEAVNIEKAKINLQANKITGNKLFVCDGESIPCESDCYDVIFSVICLQHICVFEIRDLIIKDIYRVLKPEGVFCFQMGFGGKEVYPTAKYHENVYDAKKTNGGYDVSVENESVLKNHLLSIGFTDIQIDVRETGPADNHKNWVWVKGYKK